MHKPRTSLLNNLCTLHTFSSVIGLTIPLHQVHVSCACGVLFVTQAGHGQVHLISVSRAGDVETRAFSVLFEHGSFPPRVRPPNSQARHFLPNYTFNMEKVEVIFAAPPASASRNLPHAAEMLCDCRSLSRHRLATFIFGL